MHGLRFCAKRIVLSNLADDSGPQDRAELSGTARALSLRLAQKNDIPAFKRGLCDRYLSSIHCYVQVVEFWVAWSAKKNCQKTGIDPKGLILSSSAGN
jgi:hypothetical protein